MKKRDVSFAGCMPVWKNPQQYPKIEFHGITLLKTGSGEMPTPFRKVNQRFTASTNFKKAALPLSVRLYTPASSRT